MTSIVGFIASAKSKSECNIGDYFASPLRYLPFDNRQLAIYDLDALGNEENDLLKNLDPQSHVIIGGGALLYRYIVKEFDRKRERLMLRVLNYFKGVKIIWGCGLLLELKVHPEIYDKCDLIGIRDHFDPDPNFPKVRYVPCASCLAPEFDEVLNMKQVPKTPIKLYGCTKKNRAFGRDTLKLYKLLRNRGTDLLGALSWLNSANRIATNSYHGYYWCKLLGQTVTPHPNPIKNFDNLSIAEKRDRAIYAKEFVLIRKIAGLNLPEHDALSYARSLNMEFYREVLNLMEMGEKSN